MEQTALIPPPPPKSNNAALAIGAAVFAVAAGVGAYLLIPRTGTLSINVTDSKNGAVDRVDVFVDGKKECETTPCTVKKESGSHEIKVVATGYETPAPRKVELSSGKNDALEFKLTASGGGSSAGGPGTSNQVQGTGFRATSAASALKLFLDDKEIGVLPQELKELTPGDHKIRIVGGRAYATIERQVTVVKGEMLDLGSIAPKVLHGTANFELDTPGAKVLLVSGSERRDLSKFPSAVELDTAKTWSIEATKVGFDPLKMPVIFEDGHADKSVHIALNAKGAPVAVALPTPPVGGPGPATPPNGGTPPTPPATAPTAATPAVAGAPVSINFNSIPASKVVLDGRPLGETPKLGLPVPPGSHVATFIWTEQGKRSAVPFVVEAGKPRTVIGKLPQ